MALELVDLKMIPLVQAAPEHYLWSSDDAEAEVLYINFKKPSQTNDSELIDDNIIIRYEGETVIGLNILHASRRTSKKV